MERFQSRDQQLRQFIGFVIGIVSKRSHKVDSIEVRRVRTFLFFHCLHCDRVFYDLNLLRMQLYRSGTVESRYNEVLGITNDSLYPSNSKIYEKEPRYNETSL